MEKVDAPLERALGGVRAIESGIFLLNIACGFQERTRIDRTAIDADFEVQVGAGGTAGAAHGADHGAGVDLFTDMGLEAGKVRIARHETIAVADLDAVAVAMTPA